MTQLLNLPSWRAYDVDDAGRVLAGYNESGSIQLVELDPDGSATRLTSLQGPCDGRYLPGARAVIVEHDQGGDERRQLSLLRLDHPLAHPVGLSELEPLARDQRFFHKLADVASGRVAYTTNRRNSVDYDVVVLDVASANETVIYQEGGAIVEVSLGSDADSVVLTRRIPEPMSQQLLAVDAAGREVRTLTDPQERARHLRPYPTSSRGALIVTTNRERDFTVIARLELATGIWTELVAVDGHDVTGWLSPDERLILAMTNDDGVARLGLHEAATGKFLRDAELPGDGWAAEPAVPDPIWSPDSRSVVISFTSPSTPGDILRIDVETGSFTRLAESTGSVVDGQLVEPESYRVPSFDGELIPCFIYRHPVPEDAALTGSCVFHLHGGPESQAVRAFNPIIQALASAGHVVVVPNVRGSNGYGKRWYSADDVRLRLDSVRDLASLHAWLPARGLDPARAALWGVSYGGYLVLAGLAFQPELWAAGVDIVGISSLVTFLENTSRYRRAQREPEYGSLDQDRDFLEQASPLGSVDAIRAPLFIIHGANDPRVPLTEARQIAAALKAHDIECELLVYEDEGHGLAKRANRLDAYPRAMKFLAQHLRAE